MQPSDYCPCSNGDPSTCPGQQQACIGNGPAGDVCVTCGENGTDNKACKNGLACSAPATLCNKDGG
jgi:hypothetical protein